MNHAKKLSSAIALFLFLSSFSVTNAQVSVISVQEKTSHHKPKWVSSKGYWVVESNGTAAKEHIIHFYNNANQLVYRESLSGVTLKTSRRSVKMKLKKVLETSVAGWELKKEQAENLALVARVL